jgi:hypothetical protein
MTDWKNIINIACCVWLESWNDLLQLGNIVTHSVVTVWLLWQLYHVLKHCWMLCSGRGFNTVVTLLWISLWNSKQDSWSEILLISGTWKVTYDLYLPDLWVIFYVSALVSLIVFGQKLLSWRTFAETWELASLKINLFDYGFSLFKMDIMC